MRTVVSLVFVTALAANLALWLVNQPNARERAAAPVSSAQYDQAHVVATNLYAAEATRTAAQEDAAWRAVREEQAEYQYRQSRAYAGLNTRAALEGR